MGEKFFSVEVRVLPPGLALTVFKERPHLPFGTVLLLPPLESLGDNLVLISYYEQLLPFFRVK